jgi:hypothetical protein
MKRAGKIVVVVAILAAYFYVGCAVFVASNTAGVKFCSGQPLTIGERFILGPRLGGRPMLAYESLEETRAQNAAWFVVTMLLWPFIMVMTLGGWVIAVLLWPVTQALRGILWIVSHLLPAL